MPDLAAARRAWRILFVGYAIALTVGTHWPRLQLGTQHMPAPDKLIHLGAFGGLAILLWMSGWLPRPGLFALVALAWPVLDEATQALPFLGRTVSWIDLVSGQLGATIVIATRWALRPIGGPANRRRLALRSRAFERVFGRPRGWVVAGSLGLVGASLGAAAGLALSGFTWLGSSLFMAFAVGLIAAHAAIEELRGRELDVLAIERRCPRCERPSADAPFADDGVAACPGCGATLWAGDWSSRMDLPRAVLVRLAVRPALAFLGGLACLLGMYLLAVVLHAAVSIVGDVGRGYNALPRDFRLNLDLTLIAILLAMAVRLYRRGLARRYDAQHVRCLRCGHAVHASPMRNGVGRCGECGREFFAAPAEPP